MTTIYRPPKHIRPTRKSPLFNRKGKTKELIKEIMMLKEMNEASEEITAKKEFKRGFMSAKMSQIEGFTSRPTEEGWMCETQQTITIDETIDGGVITKLPNWLKMNIPVKIQIEITDDNGAPEMTRTRIRKPNGDKINLFHSNSTSTCWGTYKLHLIKQFNEENIRKLIQTYKEMSRTVNYYSMYSVDNELLTTKEYIKRKYKYKDLSPEEELELKERIINTNPYITKEGEQDELGIQREQENSGTQVSRQRTEQTNNTQD